MPRVPGTGRVNFSSVTVVLWVNAVLLVGILVALLGRGTFGASNAFAQQAMPPIAGGGGLFFMPGQIHSNVYGVYVLDVDRQTMMVYYVEDKTLRLAAARDIRFDRDLRQYNTTPPPDAIAALIAGERDDARVKRSGENAARSTAEGGTPADSVAPAGDEPETETPANETPANKTPANERAE